MRCDYCETKKLPPRSGEAKSRRAVLGAAAGLILMLCTAFLIALFLTN